MLSLINKTFSYSQLLRGSELEGLCWEIRE